MIKLDLLIEHFKKNLLEIDCKHMILSQGKDGGLFYEGAGYVRQLPDGSLTFKIFVTKHNSNLGTFFSHMVKSPSGKIEGDDTYYNLTMTSHDGDLWEALRVRPDPHWSVTDGAVLVRGALQSVVFNHYSAHRTPYLGLYFFEEYDLPLTLMSDNGSGYHVHDRAEFEACDVKFEVRCREGSSETTIFAHSDVEFPNNFSQRVQEALQYVTAKSAMWRVRVESSGDKQKCEFLVPGRMSSRTQFSAPLSPGSIEYRHHGWRLFAKYLEYGIKLSPETHWSPVAYHLYNACESTAGSADAWAVGVSVAVEALSGLIELKQDRDSADRLAEFRKQAQVALSSIEGFEEFSTRLKGLIGILGQRSPKDALYELAKTGHVTEPYIKAWSYLRNKHVHPTAKDLQKPSTMAWQKLMDSIFQTEVILRQLTFYLMGYEGPFTDYGTEGFPLRQYPLVPKADEGLNLTPEPPQAS